MKKFLFVLLLLPVFIKSYAQIDTEFWFAFPAVAYTGTHAGDKPSLYIASMDDPAVVTISQPLNPEFTPIIRNLASNSQVHVEIPRWKDLLLTSAGTTIEDSKHPFGVLIESTSDITVCYANTSDNAETYSLKGRNALGNEFLVPMQYDFANPGTYGVGIPRASIEMVATQDGTEVTIYPLVSTTPAAVGGKIQVTLNRGESFAVKAKGAQGKDHLHNTRIESTKPIAVSCSDDAVDPAPDLLGDQLVPVNLAGNKYVVVRNESGNNDVERAYIFPIQDTTIVTIDGQAQSVMHRGDKMMYDLVAREKKVIMINSDKPVVVFQVTSNGSELGGTVLPSLGCTGSRNVICAPLSDVFAFALICKIEDIENIRGNVMLYPAEDAVHIDNTWAYIFNANKRRLDTSEPLWFSNSSGIFHVALFDKPGNACSLGYYSNYNVALLNASTDAKYYVEGDDIQLTVTDPEDYIEVEWTYPNGDVHLNTNPISSLQILDADKSDVGMYIAKGQHIDNCIVEPDTIWISVFGKEKIEPDTTYACLGMPVRLATDGYSPYEWSSGETQQSITVQATEPVDYTVQSYHTGLNMISGLEDMICIDSSDSESFWNYAIPGTIVSDVRHLFSVLVNTTNTAVLSTIRMEVNGNLYVPQQVPVDNEWVQLNYVWEMNADKTELGLVLTTSLPEGVSLCFKELLFAPLFKLEKSFRIKIKNSLEPTIEANSEYLCGGAITLRVLETYSNYKWSTGETTPNITVAQPGEYTVEVGTESCSGSSTFTVKPTPELAITLDDVISVCQGVASFDISYVVTAGDLERYELQFDKAAVEHGFLDQEGDLPGDGTISVELPKTIIPGLYKATLTVYERICDEKQILPIDVMVRYPAEQVLAQRWNEVLGVMNAGYNGGIEFTAFQWYRDGELMTGETDANLYVLDGFDGNNCYSVLLTSEDGDQILSCDTCPQHLDLLEVQTTLSTLVSPGEQINLKTTEAGKAVLYTLSGTIESTWSFERGECELTAPEKRGIYVLYLWEGDKNSRYKLMVE